MSRLFGSADDADPLQLLARVLMLMFLLVPLLGALRGTEPCYPTCRPTAKQIAAAQSAGTAPPTVAPALLTTVPGASVATSPSTLLPRGPMTVAVYGDSRAFSFAEGARLVPGWTVDNYGIPTCPWVHGTDAYSWSGNSPCDTGRYVAQTGHHTLAIVYAGGILANPSLTERMADPVGNLATSLSLIDADLIVVLATPNVYGKALQDGFPADFSEIDASLAAAAAGVGVVWLPGFATWADDQGESCQPDGLHFTLECATNAAMYIAANIG